MNTANLEESIAAAYLPTLPMLVAFAGFVAAALILTGLGAAVLGRRQPVEIQLIAGWGAACCVFTAWGVLGPWPLGVLIAPMAVVAGIALVRGRCDATGAGAMAVLAVPLALVMLPLRPSQIDTWLNLLPNAAYLADWGRFPIEDGPPSHSFLPGAPYNTQFVAYLASSLAGGFAASALSWFNILLHLAMALLLARLVAGEQRDRPDFVAVALGFLLAIPLNPAFVPRISFASYGEAPLAATAGLGLYLAARIIAQAPSAGSVAALALTLAAMVNTKQSGIGLVAALAIASLPLALWRAGAGRRLGRVVPLVLAFVPALALYALWRHFIAISGADELKPLAFSDWNTAIVPRIMAAMAFAAWEKATLFVCLAAVVLVGVRALTRRLAGFAADIAILGAGVVVAFNVYLLLAYVAHFPRDWALHAHSYGRYNYQLGFVVMLVGTVTLRPWVMARLENWSPAAGRRLRVAVVALAAGLPVMAIPLLRFDRDAPQPALRRLAAEIAARIPPDAHLALLLPGDVEDTVASFLRGSLLFTAPRRPHLDFFQREAGDQQALDAALAAGFDLALVSCTASGDAALMRHDQAGWQIMGRWAYPPDLPRRHWSAMLARGPVCGLRR